MREAVPELPACNPVAALVQKVKEEFGPCEPNPGQPRDSRGGHPLLGGYWLLPDGCFIFLGDYTHADLAFSIVSDGKYKGPTGDTDSPTVYGSEEDVLDAAQQATGGIRVEFSWWELPDGKPVAELDLDLPCKPTREQVVALERVVQHTLMAGRTLTLNVLNRAAEDEDEQEETVENAHSIHASRWFKEAPP